MEAGQIMLGVIWAARLRSWQERRARLARGPGETALHPCATLLAMNDADRLLVALAARQRQVFARRQARLAGLTDAGIHRRVRAGVFVVRGPHTLHLAGSQLDWRGGSRSGSWRTPWTVPAGWV